MATHRNITDGLLCKLAENIEPDEQMETLARTLGFEQAAINRYTETNILEGQVTCKGTRDMLFDWRQRVEPSNQHPRLRQALIDANLIMLADTYLKKTLVTQVPDIYSKKISESLTVRKCRTILEDNYSNSLCKIQMKPWDKNDYAEFEDMHTVVTMVKKDSRGNDIKEKEILQGSVGKIFSAKVNGKFPSRILISAPAGRGKTTAVAKMAHDWVHREEGSGLEDLPLLFVVKFRNTSHSTSIGEAIISQLLGDVKDLTPEGLEEFIRQHQGICHIVLDGLDEYAGIPSLSNIMNIITWEMFPECRVLVTTRPHLEYIFNQGDLPRVYTKMGIEGFSRENARDYIDRFFTSVQKPMEADGLKVYLDGQPLIDELVKTPLFCLMVCHLWSEDLLQRDTTTQTTLLDQVNVFLMFHANARTPGSINTPEQLNKIILKLGEVALTGLLADSKKLVFTPRDFKKIPSVLDKACELGIVSKTTLSNKHFPQTNETSSTTIQFYHKLAQEHAAGKFLGDETNNFLLNLKISKLDQVLRKINENIVEYENLIRFAAATKSTACVRIMEMLLTNRYLSESERYRIILDCSSDDRIDDVKVLPFFRRCHIMRLKSPTIYTCVGIGNLPRKLKHEVVGMAIEESAVTTSVTNKLWHYLRSFPMLRTLDISDSYLSFPSSPPELPSVTKLSATRMMSQCCNHLISSLPCLRNIDVKDAYEEDFVDVLESSTCLTSLEHLHVGSRDGWYFKFDASSGVQVRITMSKESELTADGTRRIWSCLKSFPSLHTIGFTDSYLSIPSSLPELPSFSRLTAKRMTLNCYKSVLSSLPNARELDVSLVIEDTSMNIFEITTDTKPMKKVTEYPHHINMINITLQRSAAPTSDVMNEVQYTSRGITLLFADVTKEHWRLFVCGEMDKYEPIMVDLFDRTTQLPFLKSISYKSPNAVDRVEVESPPSEAKTESESQLAESESRLSNFESQSRTSQPTVQPEEIDILTAVQLGHTSAIERLMRHGADINAPSIDGQICLHNAIKFCYKIERNVEETDTLKKISDEVYNGSLTLERALVFYLLDNGARVDVKDGSGKLPIHYAKDDVIKQMIFSRYKSVEEMQSYREKPAQRPDLTVVADGCVPKEIELEDRGVSMLIPSDAIHRDETPQITLTLLRDPTSLDIKDDETLACYGIRCDPPNMGFLRPVKIKIPHATLVANPEQVKPEIILYEWDSVNDLPRTTRHSSSNSPNKPPYCRLYERYLELYIGHCAEWWVVIPLEQHVIQHRFMCVPYTPDRVDSGKAINVHLIMHANLPDMDAEIQEEEKKQSYHKAHPSIPISLATKSGNVDVISYRNDQAKDNKPERRVLSLKDALSKIKHQIVLPVTSHDDDTDIPVNIKIQQKGKKYDVSMSLSFIIRCSGERDLEPTPFNRVVEEVSRRDFQDSDILNIAEKMTVDHFYDLGVALGFKIPQLHAIEYRRLADRQQATFDMLVTWRKTQTSPQGAKEKLISIMESLDSSTTEMDIREITSMASVSEIPDKILLDFSRKIKPEKYFEIGKRLDLNRTELEHIEHRTLPNRRETNIQMLSKWKSSQPPGEKAMETLKLVWESVQSVGTVDNGIGSDNDTSTDLKQPLVEETKPIQQESRPEKMEIIKTSESDDTSSRPSWNPDSSLQDPDKCGGEPSTEELCRVAQQVRSLPLVCRFGKALRLDDDIIVDCIAQHSSPVFPVIARQILLSWLDSLNKEEQDVEFGKLLMEYNISSDRTGHEQIPKLIKTSKDLLNFNRRLNVKPSDVIEIMRTSVTFMSHMIVRIAMKMLIEWCHRDGTRQRLLTVAQAFHFNDAIMIIAEGLKSQPTYPSFISHHIIDHREGKLTLDQLRITVSIPKGAIPKGRVSVTIRVSTDDCPRIPLRENEVLISPIIETSLTQKLTKPAMVVLPYCMIPQKNVNTPILLYTKTGLGKFGRSVLTPDMLRITKSTIEFRTNHLEVLALSSGKCQGIQLRCVVFQPVMINPEERPFLHVYIYHPYVTYAKNLCREENASFLPYCQVEKEFTFCIESRASHLNVICHGSSKPNERMISPKISIQDILNGKCSAQIFQLQSFRGQPAKENVRIAIEAMDKQIAEKEFIITIEDEPDYTVENRESHGRLNYLSNNIIEILADVIHSTREMKSLASHLGFSYSSMNRHSYPTDVSIDRFSRSDFIEMLNEWRQRVRPSEQVDKLHLALRNADLGYVNDVILYGVSGSSKISVAKRVEEIESRR